ncbi:SDR family NAD(P)-dependent oxidoreductase [Streptomyces broussonetiae]|uniref:SDR family NAD(P)-dependent oxidoreductase n=1 Tax=Streptomyces broussonetiae TaxID=2686304 RepID=A0A6I6NFU5_9ACTN|nr:SDR family NAD(P)-dependent oxidoreductase [Streptomyces broussonetiae]QHA09211.1 SDR family NAD(P)-dependent oxidoreductase [Streptomyces broussonetiae]
MSEERVALITSSSTGIGAAVTRRMAAARLRVVVNSASPVKAGEELAAALPDAVYVQGDISDPADAARLVDTAIERFGRLDILVNNAGRTRGSRDWINANTPQRRVGTPEDVAEVVYAVAHAAYTTGAALTPRETNVPCKPAAPPRVMHRPRRASPTRSSPPCRPRSRGRSTASLLLLRPSSVPDLSTASSEPIFEPLMISFSRLVERPGAHRAVRVKPSGAGVRVEQ